MKRSEVQRLYYITPIENLASILDYGIVCFEKAKKLTGKSIADPAIQERRERLVPGTSKHLHEYANFYFNPRNPMMYKRQSLHQQICILCIDHTILDKSEAIISDGNASSKHTRFEPSPSGLRYLDSQSVYARYWTSDDVFEGWERKRRICAEVLIPTMIEASFVVGIYVSCMETQQKVLGILGNHALAQKISINPDFFFQSLPT